VTDIKNAPQNAYDSCQQYLAASPSDDPKRVEYVKRGSQNMKNFAPMQFLQGLTTDQEAP
jgi:hypothetical protein